MVAVGHACCGDYPDYTFTEADAGQATFNFAFNEVGTQNVRVYDHANGNRSVTTNDVTVTDPPPPSPPPPGSPPPGYPVPPGLGAGGSIPYHFGLPLMAVDAQASNHWEGYPDYKVPAGEGAIYLTAGFAHRKINDASWATFYTVNYLGWENPLTDQRDSGGGTDGGPSAGDDYAFKVDSAGATWPISDGPSTLSLNLAAIAPANTEGVHLDVHTGGNALTSPFVIGANTGFDMLPACGGDSVAVGDPIDTRSGGFYLVERDLGVATGCQGIDLRFQRVYRSQSLLADTPFGYGWTHNYNQAVITLTEEYVAVRRPYGENLIFKDVGSDVYASIPGLPYILVKRPGGGWALVDQDQYVDLFDAEGKLIAQQDPNGNMVWLTYETATRGSETVTRLARVDAPGGRYLWFGYDYYDIDTLSQVADHTGRTVQYAYDDYGFLEVVTDTVGVASSYTYDNFLMTSQTDPAGNTVFSNQYDNGGRVITQTNSMGEFLVLNYEATTQTITTTVTEQNTGAVATYVYGTDDGQLEKVIDPVGATTQYRNHTNTRRPTEIEDALGHVTQIAYNERGWPTVITDTMGHSVEIAYDNWGEPLVLTDTLGRVTQFVYDGPNLVEMIDPAEQSVQFVYEDQAGWQKMLTGIVNQAGRTITYTYDALYRLIEAQESTGDLYQYSYDAAGNRLSKLEPGEAVTATYDAANQLLALNGQAASHDANGNLLDDGAYTYTYNDLDQLIAVTDGISQTLYGYNGDGDRLWQRSDGMTTTFTLDLNGALAQVLAQTPQAGNGGATYFVPGTGAQQTENVWRYLHSDGLGSVRHVTGAAGQAVGQMRYTPFGEMAEQSGATSLFGFTGEPQGSVNDLVYLRARYYNPALGRFLTQDSLIPDVTNGQALNPYAYVYNDPINLVDPSGNIPSGRLSGGAAEGVRSFAEGGLRALNWWYDQPDNCECSADPYDSIINYPIGTPSIAGEPYPVTPGVVANSGYQLWWAYKSTPATRTAVKTVEKLAFNVTRVSHKVPQFVVKRLWPFAPTTISRPSLSWSWKVVERTSGSYPFVPSGKYRTGLLKRASIDRSPLRIRPGVTGFVGSIAGAGLIDGLFQTLIDLSDRCLSLNQRFWRSFTAMGLGVVAGFAGTVVFTSLVAATFPGIVAAGVGFVASASVGYVLNRTMRAPGFAANPDRYGRER